MATLDLTDDPGHVWDQLERVNLVSTRDGGDMTDAVLNAKRRQLSKRERAASGGAYAGADLVWLIPAKDVKIGALKPGDLVIEEDETRWTALSADLAALKSFWRLTCINLSIIFDLRDLIDIERPAISYDAAGVAVKLFPSGPAPTGGSLAYSALPSRVQLLSQEIVDERGIHGFKGTHAVYVDRQIAITNEDRIRWTEKGVTRYLEILGHRNPERLDELPVIDAVLAP